MQYTHPVSSRYPCPHMNSIWNSHNRTHIMRGLWVSLASCQKHLGVSAINDEMLHEMNTHKGDIDIEKIRSYEEKLGHDIMAHIYAFGDKCPNARKVIHLGVTSNFINDNTDAILVRDSMCHISQLADKLFGVLREKSMLYLDLPTIAYTHLQPAQLITLGKRFTMWNSDLFMDITHIKRQLSQIPFRGVKGTVGSEDTLLKLFDGNYEKCVELNAMLAAEYSFGKVITICGQTYSRKYDVEIFRALSGVCQTIYKMANDIRLLASHSLIRENFGETQVGSSAMPYKQNPIHLEQLCSLCRYVIGQESVITQTYINQWLERSLDDSAVKRILYPECFMLVEYILTTCIHTIQTLVVNEDVARKQVLEKMHNVVSEEIMICGVKMGYDRQTLHEIIKNVLLSYNTTTESVLDIYKKDEILETIIANNTIHTEPSHYIGCCIEQVKTFYSECDCECSMTLGHICKYA